MLVSSLTWYAQAVYEEALIWRQLKHDHIITIYGINKTLFAGSEASHCIVMPWMKSGNIRQHIGSLIERNQDYSVPQWVRCHTLCKLKL